MKRYNGRFFYKQAPDIENMFFCPKNERPPWCLSDFQTTFCVDPVCLEATESHPYNLVYSSVGDLRIPYTLRLCPESTWARYGSEPEDICAMLNDVCESVELEGGFFFFYWGEICVKSNLDGKYVHSILPYYDYMIRAYTPRQKQL